MHSRSSFDIIGLIRLKIKKYVTAVSTSIQLKTADYPSMPVFGMSIQHLSMTASHNLVTKLTWGHHNACMHSWCVVLQCIRHFVTMRDINLRLTSTLTTYSNTDIDTHETHTIILYRTTCVNQNPRLQLEDSAGAKFYCPHALADGKQYIQTRQHFSLAVLPMPHP